MFSRYFIWVAIAVTVFCAVFLRHAWRWWALVRFGLVIEGVALHLIGWPRVVVMGIGAVPNGAGLIMSTIYRYRRTLKAGERDLVRTALANAVEAILQPWLTGKAKLNYGALQRLTD